MYSVTVCSAASCIIIVAALALKGGIFHGTSTERDFYHDVLEQVVFDRYYARCAGEDAETSRLFEAYRAQWLADSMPDKNETIRKTYHAYNRHIDAVKRKRLMESPRCLLYYRQDFDGRTTSDADNPKLRKVFIDNIRNEALLTEGWNDVSIDAIGDSLILPALLTPEDLKIDYLDIRSAKSREHIRDSGLGFVTFSKAVFNKHRDRAVVYYEMLCGGFCGEGQILVVQKKMGRWYVTRYFQQMQT